MRTARRRLPGGGAWDGLDAVSAEEARGARRGLRRLRTLLLGIVVPVLSVVVIVSLVLAALIYQRAHPGRHATTETPASIFVKYEEASFLASDGVRLGGWWIPAKEGVPVLILGHDLGASRVELLGLAGRLAEAGYPSLLLDFRGHGTSAGSSSFGTLEKRDLIGAIDWIGRQRGVDGQRIGIVGVGMGAHAAILAAAERPQVRCLVLDSPYADAPDEFAFSSLPTGNLHRYLAPWAVQVYDLMYRVDSHSENAAARVRQLSDRDLLFLAPKESDRTAAAARAMYDSVPESKTHDKNLLLLPATQTTNLYKDDRARYDEAILGFCRSYLPAAGRPAPPPRGAPATH